MIPHPRRRGQDAGRDRAAPKGKRSLRARRRACAQMARPGARGAPGRCCRL